MNAGTVFTEIPAVSRAVCGWLPFLRQRNSLPTAGDGLWECPGCGHMTFEAASLPVCPVCGRQRPHGRILREIL